MSLTRLVVRAQIPHDLEVSIEFDDASRHWICRTEIHHPNLRKNQLICSCLLSMNATNVSEAIQQILQCPQQKCSNCVKNTVAWSEHGLSPDLATQYAQYSDLSMPLPKHIEDAISALSPRTLLQTGSFHDIKLYVGKTIFRCHRFVLRKVSPVFEALCSHDYQQHVIEGQSTTLFARLLTFIYEPSMFSPARMSASDLIALLRLSTQFQVQGLSKRIVIVLIHSATVDNICDMALAAEALNLGNLMLLAASFIISRIDRVRLSEAWPRLAQSSRLSRIVQRHTPTKLSETTTTTLTTEPSGRRAIRSERTPCQRFTPYRSHQAHST